MTPIFTISVLAINSVEITRRCLTSIFLGGDEFNLILTDNGSTDGTGEYFDEVAARFPDRVRVVHNKENLGFQVPHTLALNMCTTPFFVLLNNDTEVPRGWLEKLHDPFSDESVALSGPFGACCSLTDEFHGFPGTRFEYLEGSCLMCRVDIVKKHGLFAPYLEFAYGEDSDLSLRMRQLGYRLARVPITVKHIQGVTSKKIPGIWKYQERNHAVLKSVWAHYMRHRIMDYPIVVRRNEAIGDVLLTTPVIHELKLQHPLSDIYVETKTPELFERNRDVRAASRTAPALANALVIDLNMSYENMDWPIIESYAITAGVQVRDRSLHFSPSDSDRAHAQALISDETSPVCVMHVGPTDWPGKNWPLDRFHALMLWLRERGWVVAMIGNRSDFRPPDVVDLRGRCTIGQSAAVLSRAQLFVGLDSFPMHLAMSQKVPTVAVFGATLPHYILSEGTAIGVHAPVDSVPCIGERHRAKGKTFVGCDGACTRAVSINMMKDAINQLIGYS